MKKNKYQRWKYLQKGIGCYELYWSSKEECSYWKQIKWIQFPYIIRQINKLFKVPIEKPLDFCF